MMLLRAIPEGPGLGVLPVSHKVTFSMLKTIRQKLLGKLPHLSPGRGFYTRSTLTAETFITATILSLGMSAPIAAASICKRRLKPCPTKKRSL